VAALTKNIALLGHMRYAQAATITASSEQPAYGAANLKGTALWTTVWRSAEGVITGVEVKMDLGAPKAVQGVALVGGNFSLTCTRSVIFSNNANLSSPVYTEPMGAAFDNSLPPLRDDTPPWGRHMIYLHAAGLLTARYVAFQINDPDNAYGFLRASIGLAEEVWQPVRNMERGWERGGRLQGDPGVEQHLRELQIPLHRLTQLEERQVMSLSRSLKSTGRLLVVPEPTSRKTWQQDVIWGVFQGTSKATAVDQKGRFRTLALNFQEVDE
jgi:hypothetical protein